jgi:hypothetical protein
LTVETRYFRSDSQTVNGLSAYKLGTSQSASLQYVVLGTGRTTATGYAGIRVWKRSSDGTETEITAGTPVAQVSRNAAGEGLQSAAWSCPSTSLSPTDAIVIRVYGKWGTGLWTLVATFITEQLGAQSLDAATWTVYYYTHWYSYIDPDTGKLIYEMDFEWGLSGYDSRIENFSWTPVPAVVKKPIMNGLVYVE